MSTPPHILNNMCIYIYIYIYTYYISSSSPSSPSSSLTGAKRREWMGMGLLGLLLIVSQWTIPENSLLLAQVGSTSSWSIENPSSTSTFSEDVKGWHPRGPAAHQAPDRGGGGPAPQDAQRRSAHGTWAPTGGPGEAETPCEKWWKMEVFTIQNGGVHHFYQAKFGKNLGLQLWRMGMKMMKLV